MSRFFENYARVSPWLQPSKENESLKREIKQSIEDRDRLEGCENCLLCGCCSASCPSYWWSEQQRKKQYDIEKKKQQNQITVKVKSPLKSENPKVNDIEDIAESTRNCASCADLNCDSCSVQKKMVHRSENNSLLGKGNSSSASLVSSRKDRHESESSSCLSTDSNKSKKSSSMQTNSCSPSRCGVCTVTSCPSSSAALAAKARKEAKGKEGGYLGPAALLQAYRWVADSRDSMKEQRLKDLGEQRGSGIFSSFRFSLSKKFKVMNYFYLFIFFSVSLSYNSLM